MAESKKSSSGTKKTAHQTRNEAAEALRQAAELIESLNSAAQANETTKKPAAKKPATKKPAAKKPAAKSGTAKKPAAKKPAAKTEPKPEAEEKPAEPQKKFGNRRSDCKNCGAENDKYALVCHACGAQLPPLPEGMVPPVQQPVVEEKPVEQPVVEEKPAEPVVEEKPVEEKPAEEQPAGEQKPEEQPVAPTEQPVEEKPAQPVKEKPAKKSGSFLDKVSNFINNKGKLPLWIVANALLLLSSIFLMIGAFNFSVFDGTTRSLSVFNYFIAENTYIIKTFWVTAGAWVNGGYVMIGILMWIATLVPLALIVKNVVFLVLKKDKEVHMLDAIITFAFLVAYLGVVGMYGANITWAHVLSLIMSIILLAYTIFVILLENRGGMFPFFSIANLVWILLCMFLLTNTKIYDAPRCYAAYVAGLDSGAVFGFVMLLIAIAVLVLLIVMQVKKLPSKIAWLFEFLVPAVAGVLALIALITFAGLTPVGYTIGPAFVCGAVFTLLLAIVDVVFALVPQLHKFNVKVADKVGKKEAQPAEQLVNEQPAEQPAPVAADEQPTSPDKVKCPACGMENGKDDMYCMKCGRKLK